MVINVSLPERSPFATPEHPSAAKRAAVGRIVAPTVRHGQFRVSATRGLVVNSNVRVSTTTDGYRLGFHCPVTARPRSKINPWKRSLDEPRNVPVRRRQRQDLTLRWR